MEYQRASLIRGTSLSSLIGERYSAGQGFGGAIRGAISDKLKAKAVGLKERVDPLNIVRQLTGQGAFGNIMTAVAGRAMGRSQRDIAYFGGYTRRRSTMIPTEVKESRGTGGSVGQNSEMLEKIYQFLKRSTDERKRIEQINRSFRREQINEDERRHQDLIDAIKGFTVEPTAKPVKEKDGGFLDMIKSMISGAIGKLMESFAWLKDLKNLAPSIIGFFKLFTNNTLSVLTRLIPLLGNPMFLAVAAGAATIYGLYKLITSLAEITPDFKQLSPAEARAALEDENEIVMQAKKRYKREDVTPEQIKETKEYLENRVLKGKEEAERINKIEDAAEREKAIRDFGGEALLKKTLEDQNVYTLPTEEELKQIRERNLKEKPEKVVPRPTKGGVKLANDQMAWDMRYKSSHDPITGVRLDLLPNSSVGVGRSTMAGPSAEEMATLSAGAGRGSMAGPTAAEMSALPTNETFSPVSERGSMVEPTAEQMQMAPQPAPTPVPKMMPDIPPTPELPPISSMMQEPFIQTNTNTNIIGGKKDKVLATSTPKQRNTDLNRYLSNGSVAV